MSNIAITIGRLGYFGLGIESSPGSAAAASAYLPYTDTSLRAHHEPIGVISSRTARFGDTGSVVGKKWSEGDIKMDLDVVNSGYLFKMALGNEIYTAGTPSVHQFYATVSGNTPTTATVIRGRDTDVEQYTYLACDDLTMQVSNGLAELTASLKGDFPTAAASQTVTTLSGTVLSFKDMTLKFGNTLTAAASASATATNELSLTVSNNLEVIHRSGSATVSAIRTKQMQVKGNYTLFFDSTTDRDAYYALNKRSLEVNLTGNANESCKFRIPRFRLSEGDISSGIDDFFIIKAEFVAEDVVDSTTATRLVDVTLNNSKASIY